MSQRGQGNCYQCNAVYFNRYKPEKCASCGFQLGGSYQPKTKKHKNDVPRCVQFLVQGTCCFYSCQTVRNQRCFFVVDGDDAQCHTESCKLARAAFINSGSPGLFTCAHIARAEEAVAVMSTHTLTQDVIDQYKADDITKDRLAENMNGVKFPHLYRLSDSVFCVYGPPTSSNPIGFAHLTVANGKIECSSNDCKGYGSVMRQEKTKKICIHCHTLLCFFSLSMFMSGTSRDDAATSNPVRPTTPPAVESTTTPQASTAPCVGSSDVQSSNSRASTIKLNMLNTLPYEIPSSILEQISTNDSRSNDPENASNGWPRLYSPQDDSCRLCASQLSSPRPHPGQKAGAVSYVLTNAVAFLPVEIFVKFCTKEDCKAMHQVFPFNIGLFNISDKLLVSLDILLEIREFFRRGVPLSVVIDSKLAILSVKAKQIVPSLEYVSDLLYNGFYCFELLTVRSLDSQICGICGVLGEVYLGDGNQKNCCSRSEISYAPESQQLSSGGHPLPLDQFLERIRCHFVERNTYTRAAKSLNFHISEIPPVVAPKLSGATLWNTEIEKNSQFLKNQAKVVEGDPALLHAKIRDCALDMSNLKNKSLTEVKKLALDLGITVSQKSKQCLLGNINELYATLLVGNCPCHQFTKVPGHTGGFYHIVCRHGVTVISKCLALQESVRDAADLFLSLKYPPLLFICDTACGFVRHMDCRAPDVSEKLWGKFSGCFEVPESDKSPSEGMNVPYIVPSEYLASSVPLHCHLPEDDPLMHPISGDCRRYVLGDRFHSASNPHKSPLCAFHNINLCLQANTVKTSYQESENNRKNIRRLRSACVQGFGVHFLYNYLMDFYQNEAIVRQQIATLKKNAHGQGDIVRDEFMRFTYIQSVSK